MAAGEPQQPAASPLASGNEARGFTLIELLIVMAIVALLLTIALPNYLASADKSKDMVLRENLRVMRVALDRFFADKGHFPGALNELVEQRYLRAVPVDPITESNQTWVTIEARTMEGDDASRVGIADVKSGAPGTARDGRPYDAY